MPKNIDLTGKRYGRLVVLKYTGRNNGKTPPRKLWQCMCDCGNSIEITTSNLTRGNTRSCGCLATESATKSIINNTVNKLGVDSKEFKQVKQKATMTYTKSYVKEGTNVKNLDMAIAKNNTSGHKGVSWDKNRSKWLAYIKFKSKRINLGRFADKQDAINARIKAEEKYFNPVLEKYGKVQVEQ